VTAPTNAPQGVDVLRVLDDAIEVMYRDSYSAIPDDLTRARAAVSELIRAANVASLAMADAADSDFMGDSYHEAISNLRAALARASGGPL
jgi:hypothetical protein